MNRPQPSLSGLCYVHTRGHALVSLVAIETSCMQGGLVSVTYLSIHGGIVLCPVVSSQSL